MIFVKVDCIDVVLTDVREQMVFKDREIASHCVFKEVAGNGPVFVLPFVVRFRYLHSIISKMYCRPMICDAYNTYYTKQ